MQNFSNCWREKADASVTGSGGLPKAETISGCGQKLGFGECMEDKTPSQKTNMDYFGDLEKKLVAFEADKTMILNSCCRLISSSSV